ncbi:hypothetical protein FHL15_001308 [Xylaria flabelliformis]|uniref:Uncharacterized protein n=1 Tax=Xylaria flabelliformis TaxID=2512241 RepID=A0A553IBH7_9PEZI|nr:hypothetical protein FHL15_001308 [Xylaria flabelliformis]
MPPIQQPSTEASGKVSVLRELLQQPSSKQIVAPFVAAIMARDVDIHERMLADLRDRVQQMEGGLSNESKHTSRLLERVQQVEGDLSNESKHTSRLLERMHLIEQDAKSLQELVKGDREKDIDARFDPDQLKVVLSEAINQHCTEITTVGQRLQTIQEIMEEQKQITNRVKEILDIFGQRTESLQGNISGLKDGLERVPLPAPIIERIAEFEERMVKYLDRSSKDAEIIKRSLAAVQTIQDPQGGVDHTTCQPIDNNQSPSDYRSDQSKPSPKQPDLEEWPAIADFVTVYQRFLESYKSKKPEDDLKFIEAFLEEITEVNMHVSRALQSYLLEMYPKKIVLISSEVGQQRPDIFIKLVRVRWNDVRRAIAVKDLRAFQWASNDDMSGPSPATK